MRMGERGTNMAEIDLEGAVYDYSIPRLGINLNKNMVKLDLEESIQTQNMYWENGLVKRGGTSLFDSNRTSQNHAIHGLHRAYFSDETKYTIAAANIQVEYSSGSGWTLIKTGLTADQEVYFSTIGWADKVYFGNGIDVPQKWNLGDGVNAVSAASATTLQFLGYRDRILAISEGDLTWSDSFDDSNFGSVANIGIRPDTKLNGMILHAVNDGSDGIDSKVLLAGDNGMYLFSGTDLRWPATTGDYSIFQLGVNSGCTAPRTMVWTPRGSMWLGVDRQIYLLPFNGATPIPVGTKLWSHSDTKGLDSIPAPYLKTCCAVYHDGFYKISIPVTGDTHPTREYWLDINRATTDENGHFGPWYGPMIGQTISCYVKQGGVGVSGELLGGGAQDCGYVYNLNREGVYGDLEPSASPTTIAIEVMWETRFDSLGDYAFRKDVHECEFELLNTDSNVTLNFKDMGETLKSNDTLQLLSAAITWGDQNWGTFDWTGYTPIRKRHPISPAIQPRRLSIRMVSQSSDSDFEVYSLHVKAIEQNAALA